MKKLFSKLFASIITVVMLAVGVGAMSASAITPAIVPGSRFNYEVYAEKVSGYSDRIKLEIVVTNNPGVSQLGIAVKHDSSCTLVSYEGTSMCVGEDENGVFLLTWLSGSSEYDGDMWFEIIFDVPGMNAVTHEFSVCVTRYISKAENLRQFLESDSDTSDASFQIGNTTAIVGDLDGDKDIDPDDAYLVQVLLSDKIGKSSVSLTTLGDYLCKNKNDLGEFKGMVNDQYICAAVADGNGDCNVTNMDSTAILNYYASHAVGSSTLYKYLGKAPVVAVKV